MEGKSFPSLLPFERASFTIILLIVLIILSMPFAAVATRISATKLDVQNVDIQVRVRMRNGAPAIYPRVQIFHLTDQGPQLITSGSGDQSGLYSRKTSIPRVSKNERMYLAELGKEVDVYDAVNILVAAYDEKSNSAGSIAFSLDPTFMKWPFDSVTTEVTLTDELPRAVGASSVGVLSAPPTSETWQFTPVIEYAVWDQISAYAIFPVQAKIDIEMKRRFYDPTTNTYGSWQSSGYTTITLDRGFGLPTITGKQKYTGSFKFKYMLCYISIAGTPFYWETVYAADTPNSDPIENKNSWASWSGSASGSNPFITAQNTPWTEIPVTSTSQWIFSVGVSFGVSYPPGSVSIGVSLSVSRQSIPYGRVYISTGTWTQGYKVYTYGREYGFRKSYSVWKP